MGQIGVCARTGSMVEAFSANDVQWDNICKAPRGKWLMPRSDWPAVPKTSIRGLRFFAHYKGYSGTLPKPESYAHTRLKIDIVMAARALGYRADMEVAGSDLNGADWVADVLVLAGSDARFAFEVQLSSQHLNDFRARTERYRRSGIECCWIVSDSSVGARLSKAIAYENMEFYRDHQRIQADLEELLVFGVCLKSKNDYPTERPLLRFSRGRLLRHLQIDEAIEGVLRRQPSWERPDWHWNATES